MFYEAKGHDYARMWLRSFRAVRCQYGGLPLTLTVALTTGQHFSAACGPSGMTMHQNLPNLPIDQRGERSLAAVGP